MERIITKSLKGTLGALNYTDRNGKQVVSGKVAEGTINHTESNKGASHSVGWHRFSEVSYAGP